MTDNASFKRQVRDYATTHGLRYAEARTRLLKNRPGETDGDVQQVDSQPQTGEYRQFMLDLRLEGGSIRYDVDESGFVDGQQSWNGSPWLLIGFEEAGAPERSIVLSRFEWLDDPQKAVGMVPVFSDFDGTWASWSYPVIGVEQRAVRPAQDPTEVTMTLSPLDSVDGLIHLDCADMLSMLPKTVLDSLVEAGWQTMVDPDNDIEFGTDSGALLRPFAALGGDRARRADEIIGRPFFVHFDGARRWFESAPRTRWLPIS